MVEGRSGVDLQTAGAVGGADNSGQCHLSHQHRPGETQKEGRSPNTPRGSQLGTTPPRIGPLPAARRSDGGVGATMIRGLV
jgi:hypothetical protein